jgi:hypothetical protein
MGEVGREVDTLFGDDIGQYLFSLPELICGIHKA